MVIGWDMDLAHWGCGCGWGVKRNCCLGWGAPKGERRKRTAEA